MVHAGGKSHGARAGGSWASASGECIPGWLMPCKRGSIAGAGQAVAVRAGRTVAVWREPDVQTGWCRSAGTNGRVGGRSHVGGSRDGGSGVCGRADVGRVSRVGPVGGAGRAGDADRMPDGRIRRAAAWRGGGMRSEGGHGVGLEL